MPIRQRKVAPETVDQWYKKIENLADDYQQIVEEERIERQVCVNYL
jgi:hypothetical protein